MDSPSFGGGSIRVVLECLLGVLEVDFSPSVVGFQGRAERYVVGQSQSYPVAVVMDFPVSLRLIFRGDCLPMPRPAFFVEHI